jgi:hypothetical protein
MRSGKCMMWKCRLADLQTCELVNWNMRKGEEVRIGIEKMVKCFRELKTCRLMNLGTQVKD